VDRFDAKKAAGRVTRYLDWKLSLFGEEKLCKAITLGDLKKEDLTILIKGHFQRLPERDGAGRAVWVVLQSNQIYTDRDSFVSSPYSTQIEGRSGVCHGSVPVVQAFWQLIIHHAAFLHTFIGQNRVLFDACRGRRNTEKGLDCYFYSFGIISLHTHNARQSRMFCEG
jgi:hypothetical protein